MSQLLARHAVFVDNARYRGRLCKVDYYPGLVPSDDPRHSVQGEVYLLSDANRLLPYLDRYEECGPEFPEPNEYRRQKQNVLLNNGDIVTAWVYLYNHSTTDLELIESEDFLQIGSNEKPTSSFVPNGDGAAPQDHPAL